MKIICLLVLVASLSGCKSSTPSQQIAESPQPPSVCDATITKTDGTIIYVIGPVRWQAATRSYLARTHHGDIRVRGSEVAEVIVHNKKSPRIHFPVGWVNDRRKNEK